MKKRIFLAGAIVAIATAVVGWNYSQNQSQLELSELGLANIEALAGGEGSSGDPCYKGSYDSSKPEATKCAQPCTKERCGGETDKCY